MVHSALAGPITFGMAPAVAQPFITPAKYASIFLVPMEIFSVMLLLVFLLMFKPKQKFQCSRETINEEYAKLGKWSATEKITLIILIGSLIGWVLPTVGIANIDSGAVAMIGLFAMFVAQIMETKEIAIGMNWDLVLWIGILLGFSGIFNYTKLSDWIAGMLGSVFYPMAGNVTILMLALTGFLIIFRFVDVAIGLPTLAIINTLVPTFITMGISPVCIYFVTTVAGMNLFVLPYTSMFLQAADTVTKGELLTQKDSIKAGIAYAIMTVTHDVVIASYYFQATGLAFTNP